MRVIRLLEWWSIPRRGWIIILAELTVIVGLGSWVYFEYVNNAYFQIYVNSLSPILVPIVSVVFGVTSATVATLLYFMMSNAKQRGGPREEDPNRKRDSTKRIVKKPQPSSSRREGTETGARTAAPRSRFLVGGASNSKRGTAQGSSDRDDESD